MWLCVLFFFPSTHPVRDIASGTFLFQNRFTRSFPNSFCARSFVNICFGRRQRLIDKHCIVHVLPKDAVAKSLASVWEGIATLQKGKKAAKPSHIIPCILQVLVSIYEVLMHNKLTPCVASLWQERIMNRGKVRGQVVLTRTEVWERYGLLIRQSAAV